MGHSISCGFITSVSRWKLLWHSDFRWAGKWRKA